MRYSMSASATRLCRTTLALALSFGLWALPAAAERTPESRPAPRDSQEVQILQGLARGLARALGSAEVRGRIAGEIKASPYVEKRIAIKRLLAEDKSLRRTVLQSVKIGRSWDALSLRLPELELYFPVEQHRQAWRGEPGVQVAVEMEDGTFLAWDADGSTTRFEGKAVADKPTLLFGPSEIDYDDAESALIGGPRTGDYLLKHFSNQTRPVPPPEAGRTSTSVKSKSGGFEVFTEKVSTGNDTYLTYVRINGQFDSSGQMEVTVWGGIGGAYRLCQRFTGINPNTDYYLPAPGASGSRKIASAVPTGTETVDVTVYEDDDPYSCTVDSGDDYLGVSGIQITQFGTIYGTNTSPPKASVRVETGPHCGNLSCETGENTSTCCQDCGSTCGDGICSFDCEWAPAPTTARCAVTASAVSTRTASRIAGPSARRASSAPAVRLSSRS
jgi:hypothetical protein